MLLRNYFCVGLECTITAIEIFGAFSNWIDAQSYGFSNEIFKPHFLIFIGRQGI